MDTINRKRSGYGTEKASSLIDALLKKSAEIPAHFSKRTIFINVAFYLQVKLGMNNLQN